MHRGKFTIYRGCKVNDWGDPMVLEMRTFTGMASGTEITFTAVRDGYN